MTARTKTICVVPENIRGGTASGLAIQLENEELPVLVELHEGTLRLVVWGNGVCTDDEPTHIIPLEK